MNSIKYGGLWEMTGQAKVVTFIGAGGKTTCVKQLSAEIQAADILWSYQQPQRFFLIPPFSIGKVRIFLLRKRWSIPVFGLGEWRRIRGNGMGHP